MAERKFPGCLFIPLLLWCVLTALPAAGGPDWLWGLIAGRADTLVWLPAWLVVTVMTLAGLSGKTAWLERELPAFIRPAGRPFNRPGASHWLWLALPAVAAGWGLRSRNHFMGDGWALIENVRKPFYLHVNEPLDFFVHQLFSRLLALLSLKYGALAYALLAVLLLPLFLRLLWKISSLAGPERNERAAVFLILTFTGCLQLFLGYVESYTLVNLFLGLFLYLGLKSISTGSKITPWLMTAASVLAALSHLSALTLLPALAFAWLARRRPADDKAVAAATRAFVLILTVCVLGALTGILFFDLPGMTPLYTSKTGGLAPCSLLDPRYLWFKLNLLLMLAPAVFLLLIAVPGGRWMPEKSDRPEFYFLLLSAAGPLFFFLGANAMLGLRDWDLLCLPVLPLTLLAVWSFLRLRSAAAGRSLWLGAAALAAAAQTLAFVWVNSGRDSGVEFLDRMRTHEIYTGSNMLQLGYLFEEYGYLPESLRQYLGISQIELLGNRIINSGALFIRMGMPDSTINLIRDVLTRYGVADPRSLGSVYSNLSIAFDMAGQPDSAHYSFMRFLECGEVPNDDYIRMWSEQLQGRVAQQGYLRNGLDKLDDDGQLLLLARMYIMARDRENLRLVFNRIWKCHFDCEQWRRIMGFSSKTLNAEYAARIAQRAALDCPELAPQ